MPTKIPWATETINPIRTEDGGYFCEKISEGCRSCYAEGTNARFGNGKKFKKHIDPDKKYIDPVLILNEKAINKPLNWKKPRRIFVQSMSDLFIYEMTAKVPYLHCSEAVWGDGSKVSLLNKIWNVMEECPQHVFLILTKRPQIMKTWIDEWMHQEQKEPLKNL